MTDYPAENEMVSHSHEKGFDYKIQKIIPAHHQKYAE
jgi:hypothetical protein